MSDVSVTTMRRLLVVAYYFPPMGMSGVQRVAKFVKYLPEYGWEPVVLTVEPGGYFAYDEQLQEEIDRAGVEVVRTDSWDPTRLFSNGETVEMPTGWQRSVLDALTNFFFIPDNKIGWKSHALETGRELLADRSFQAIFSTAPPYTCHLIGETLSRETGLPLVTDFRDDWVGNPLLSFPTPYHRRRHEKLESRVLKASDHVTTINRSIKERLIQRNLGPDAYTRCSILPHGFDPEDFEQAAPEGIIPAGDRFRLLYCGVFYGERRPDHFLRGVRRLLHRRPELAEQLDLVFVGLVPEGTQDLIDELDLSDAVSCVGYKSHRRAVSYLLSADALWFTVGRQEGAETISTSKLYEYMGSRKPILGLVPEGAARETLQEYGCAVTAPPEDVEGISRAIEQVMAWSREDTAPQVDEKFVDQFDRRTLAGRLAKEIHGVCAIEDIE